MDAERSHLTEQPGWQKAAEQLLDLVPRLMRLISSGAQAGGSTLSLTMAQIRALALLASRSRLPSELARELEVTPATASEVADLLVRRGLVERCDRPEDRRLTPLRATPTGIARHQAARHGALSALGSLLAQLDPADLAALERALDSILEGLQKKPPMARGNERAE